MAWQCMKCKETLSGDEIALHRKLISRAAREYMCLDCLSGYFNVERQKLENLIAWYHRTGQCVLFAKTDSDI